MHNHVTNFLSAWIPNTDLNPLDPEDCKNVSDKGKTKSLIAAYEVASEKHDLQHFKNILAQHEREVQAHIEAAEAKEAEKAAKAERKKRKSEAAAAAAVEDVEMEDADDAGETKKSSKKRKKDVDSDDEEPEKVRPGFTRDLLTNRTNSQQRLRRPNSS